MSLRDLFKKKPAKVSPSTDKINQHKIDKEKVQEQLRDTKIASETQKELARRNILAARNRALAAINNNDLNGKVVAFREIKVNLAVYRYMQSIQSAIAVMESNFRMNLITEDLMKMVKRIGRLNIPGETVNFGTLTHLAMQGLAVPDINGLDEMVEKLMGSSDLRSNSGVFLIADKLLNVLIT